jgi:hypothetical protein
MKILLSIILRDDNGIFISLLGVIWNADGGRSKGGEVSFRVFNVCLTLINGECKEWSIVGGGGDDDGGVRILIVGISDSLKWNFRKDFIWIKTYGLFIVDAENDSDKNAGFRGRGRFVILKKEIREKNVTLLI